MSELQRCPTKGCDSISFMTQATDDGHLIRHCGNCGHDSVTCPTPDTGIGQGELRPCKCDEPIYGASRDAYGHYHNCPLYVPRDFVGIEPQCGECDYVFYKGTKQFYKGPNCKHEALKASSAPALKQEACKEPGCVHGYIHYEPGTPSKPCPSCGGTGKAQRPPVDPCHECHVRPASGATVRASKLHKNHRGQGLPDKKEGRFCGECWRKFAGIYCLFEKV